MAYEFIRYEKPEEHVVAITLNRPDRLNALGQRMLSELNSALESIEKDNDVRVFLLTGATRTDGRPCFSAGGDLRSVADGEKMDPYLGMQVTNAIDDLLKPSIAVVDGVCTAGGAEIALACDFRLVAESAQVSDFHLKNLGTGLGGWGGSTRWARLVGVTNAKEIILTGKVLNGQDAYRIGFASGVYPANRLWDEAMKMARAIAGMKPEGVRLTLAHLDRVADMSRDEALRWSQLLRDWLQIPPMTEDKARGVVGN